VLRARGKTALCGDGDRTVAERIGGGDYFNIHTTLATTYLNRSTLRNLYGRRNRSD
jgi:hypothetical protein